VLAELHAKHFALFEDIDVEFSNGMNVVTGETGSGKSLFLSILKALVGEKNEFVTERSEIEARFVIGKEEFLISVKIGPSRMSARMNGSMITLAELRDKVSKWMDIHTQGISEVLRDSKMHSKFVDNFNPEIQDLLIEYRRLYKDYVKVLNFTGKNDLSQIDSTLEDLSSEMKKIEEIFLSDEEYDALRDEYKRLSNIGEIISTSKEIEYLINGENTLDTLIGKIIEKIKTVENKDRTFHAFLNDALSIEELIRALERNVSRYASSQEFDQEKIDEIEDKISKIEKMKRKYGPTLEDVRNTLKEMKDKFEFLSNSAIEIKEAGKHLEQLKAKMTTISSKIKMIRYETASELMKRIDNNLRDLSMSNARISFVQRDTEFTEDGSDSIEFVGSMNPGIPEMPISKIASGGEISRLYLAMEAALDRKLPVSTLVFDEIEMGVGARTADVIASKMIDISKSTQLIVITHLPQIATVADKHFKVEKHQLNDKTFSTIDEISGEARSKEILEMFGKPV